MDTPSLPDRAAARARMVETRIARRGIRGERLLQALREVPRELFVDADLAEFAYDDVPLPIGEGQTISQPYMVAWMIEAAAVGEHDAVLEVGAGSGYAAAVLGRVARRVHAIERLEGLAQRAHQRLDALGVRNVQLRTGDGTTGWAEAGPFDAILVAAAGPEIPAPLKAQLARGGRLVMPLDLGAAGERQQLSKVVRTGDDTYDQEILGAVAFVPLIGRHGWAEDGPHSGNPISGCRPPYRRSRSSSRSADPPR